MRRAAKVVMIAMIAMMAMIAGCDESALQVKREPVAATSASAASTAPSGSASASPRPAPLILGPAASAEAVPREAREREVEALLAGKRSAGRLEVEATDRGKEWSAGLRSMLSRPRATRIKIGEVEGAGLPAAVVSRIVRQHFGAMRLCYESGLVQNPNLIGRVGVRFTIDASGEVKGAENGGSDLPDSAVVSCVVKAVAGLTFPQPEPAPARLLVPISFAPPE